MKLGDDRCHTSIVLQDVSANITKVVLTHKYPGQTAAYILKVSQTLRVLDIFCTLLSRHEPLGTGPFQSRCSCSPNRTGEANAFLVRWLAASSRCRAVVQKPTFQLVLCFFTVFVLPLTSIRSCPCSWPYPCLLE